TNNIFAMQNAPSHYACVSERAGASSPSSLRYNAFAGCAGQAYVDYTGGGSCGAFPQADCYSAEADANNPAHTTGGTAQSSEHNVGLRGFVDLHLDNAYPPTGDTPVSVGRGGLDTHLPQCGPDGGQTCGDVLEDRNGDLRTCGTPLTDCYSRGAFI